MDFLLHFTVSFLLSTALKITMSENPNISIAFTVGIGIGKEVGGYMNYGERVGNLEFAKMASKDLLADGLGITAGLAFGMLVGDFLVK